MWNAINKINAFLCEYGMFSCFMVTGLKMEVVMSGREPSWAPGVHLRFISLEASSCASGFGVTLVGVCVCVCV